MAILASAGKRRRNTLASFIASLSPRVWLDATGLASGLLATWPNLGSAGDITSSGGLRPTATGTEVTFSGAQRMVSPSYSMGARASGAVAFRIQSGANAGVFQFGSVNAHHSVLRELGVLKMRVQSSDGVATSTVSPPTSFVVAWSMDATGGTAIVNGVSGAMPSSALGALTAPLTIGDLTGSIYALEGAIHEMVDIDAVISAGDLSTLHDGLRAKWGI